MDIDKIASIIAKGPFTELKGPFQKTKSGPYGITRFMFIKAPGAEFDDSEAIADPEYEGDLPEHDIGLNLEANFVAGEKGSWGYYGGSPGIADEAEITNFEVESVDGYKLTPEDAATMKAAIGNLSLDEEGRLGEKWLEYTKDNYDGPDDYE